MMMMLLAFNLVSLMFLVSFLSMKYNENKEKIYSFECGFNPFVKPRNPFSIQFFKILLIFLLFDMEIILMLPIPLFFLCYKYSLMFFIIIIMFLVMGLALEWLEGALNWLY